MESVVAVGEAVGEVAGVVGSVVVVGAHERGVDEVGGAAVGPGVGVVGFAPGGGDGAPVGLAVGVSEADRCALGGCVEAAGAAEVEDLGLPAEDGGQDLRLAGEAAGLAGGDGVAGGPKVARD